MAVCIRFSVIVTYFQLKRIRCRNGEKQYFLPSVLSYIVVPSYIKNIKKKEEGGVCVCEKSKELENDVGKSVFILRIVFKHVFTSTIILCVTVDDVFLVA